MRLLESLVSGLSVRSTILGFCALVSGFTAAPACSQTYDTPGRWNLGLRGGLALPIGELNGFTGENPGIGPMLSVDLSRMLGNNLVIGGNLEYQMHKMPSISGPGTGGKFSESTINVATLMAFMQYRLRPSGNWAPYLLGGLGINFNWMGDDQAGGSFDVDSTLALKLGAGADYFVSKSTALSLEAGYKLNSGGVQRWNANGSSDQRFDFDVSALYFLAGVRLYF